ncbi:hypothetical protein CLI64_11440 [Nostoc sp. CENA543]|nr:hypothetical protein CLI64_11440 [Nostoc sp. CENA543]
MILYIFSPRPKIDPDVSVLICRISQHTIQMMGIGDWGLGIRRQGRQGRQGRAGGAEEEKLMTND